MAYFNYYNNNNNNNITVFLHDAFSSLAQLHHRRCRHPMQKKKNRCLNLPFFILMFSIPLHPLPAHTQQSKRPNLNIFVFPIFFFFFEKDKTLSLDVKVSLVYYY